jgi:hypothetical protein
MNRFTKFAAAALLSLATVPALAEGEGTFQPSQVASPAVSQPGQAYAPYSFQATRGAGSHWTGPVASPARGAAQAPMVAGGYNTGLNG